MGQHERSEGGVLLSLDINFNFNSTSRSKLNFNATLQDVIFKLTSSALMLLLSEPLCQKLKPSIHVSHSLLLFPFSHFQSQGHKESPEESSLPTPSTTRTQPSYVLLITLRSLDTSEV